MTTSFTISNARFETDAERIRLVRHEVFVVEQSVPVSLEWTGDDGQFAHVLAVDHTDQPIGTGRISPSGSIGRMAVRKPWRKKGVGSAMLQQLIAIATEQGLDTVQLSSQLHAIEFYQRHGFESQGEIYLDAGIQHRTMTRKLK